LALLERKLALSDKRVEAAHDFAEGRTIVLSDTRVEGLRVRLGKHRVTFFFRHDDRRNGQRKITAETLGHFPGMTVKEARDAAKIIAGKVASGAAGPGKRAALRFDNAMADYLDHLERKAARAHTASGRGKPRHRAGAFPSAWLRSVVIVNDGLLLDHRRALTLLLDDHLVRPAVALTNHLALMHDMIRAGAHGHANGAHANADRVGKRRRRERHSRRSGNQDSKTIDHTISPLSNAMGEKPYIAAMVPPRMTEH
jgi:hypothetical protein